ncbi:MAG: plasmid partition protein ParG [Deltaproteobacteria bacterium]|nr:plasmid partition protein ParG [candidate division NC10 bacterium]MCZ6908051.1 plasmid partition protein ParG [Deltaproteobacteria bacterium]
MNPKPQKKEERIVPMPVYLPEADHKALRIASIEEGRSATDIIRELVSGWLVKRKRKKGGK